MKAWVIIESGTRQPEEIVGLLSARKSAKIVKQHVEWLYMLLNCSVSTNFASAQYNSPYIECEAKLWTTDSGVPMATGMICGHNPWLEAWLATDVVLVEEGEDTSIIKFTHPHKIIFDIETLKITGKVPGVRRQAPIRLPLFRAHQQPM